MAILKREWVVSSARFQMPLYHNLESRFSAVTGGRQDSVKETEVCRRRASRNLFGAREGMGCQVLVETSKFKREWLLDPAAETLRRGNARIGLVVCALR